MTIVAALTKENTKVYNLKVGKLHANNFCSKDSRYRYGFNGIEKDDEVKGRGNSYTTLYRQNDPRVAKWLTIDPRASQLPWQSPYNSMDNNPILHNDPLGDWVKGAGVIKNLFNSDNKINAENRALETGGEAFKDGKGWTVNFTTNEKVDFGKGEQSLKTLNVEHFGKKGGNKFAEGYNIAGDNMDHFMKSGKFANDLEGSLKGEKGLGNYSGFIDNTGSTLKGGSIFTGPFAPIVAGTGVLLSVSSDLINTGLDYKNEDIQTANSNLVIRGLTFGAGKLFDKLLDKAGGNLPKSLGEESKGEKLLKFGVDQGLNETKEQLTND